MPPTIQRPHRACVRCTYTTKAPTVTRCPKCGAPVRPQRA